MTQQQAQFVKQVITANKNTITKKQLACEFFNKFRQTPYCDGPRNHEFSAIDGHDIVTTAELMLGERFNLER